jgi:hypothetical protein
MKMGKKEVGKKSLSPNQGNVIASVRRNRFALRIIIGPESAFIERKCLSSEPQVVLGMSLWRTRFRQRLPGAMGCTALASSLLCSGAGWLQEACWSWLQVRASCSALLSGLSR